jgi:hypothetical protein
MVEDEGADSDEARSRRGNFQSPDDSKAPQVPQNTLEKIDGTAKVKLKGVLKQ